MNKQTQPTRTQPRRLRRFVLAGLASVATVAAFVLTPVGSALARPGHGGWDAPWFEGGPSVDPKVADARIDGFLKFVLADANATQEQRDKIAAIVKAARADIAPTAQKLRDGHAKFVTLLAAPTIDRTALEQLRVEQSQLRETVSRRQLQAFADAAEVLTPEQRAKLAAAHHGHRGHHQPPQAK
jgi:periplasmic protein CpxP/Spy